MKPPLDTQDPSKEKAEWYKEFGAISIAVQSGGSSDGGIFHSKIPLQTTLDRLVPSTFCDAVRHFAFIFKVSGKHYDFGDDRVDQVRRNKKEFFMSGNIIVSKKTLGKITDKNVDEFIINQTRNGLVAMIQRVKKDKLQIEDMRFFACVDQAISEHMKNRATKTNR